jgi:hypothetical protein
MTKTGLVHAILGPRLQSVAQCVRDLHFDGQRTRIAGVVAVKTGRGPLARLSCALAGIPRLSGQVPAELVIEGTSREER